MLGRVRMTNAHRRTGGLLAALALGIVVLAGCDSEGVDTDCSLDSCTLTFDRAGSAGANILGAEVKLVNASEDQATLDVAGRQVTVPANGSAEVSGLNLAVRDVTADQVIVQVTRASGN